MTFPQGHFPNYHLHIVQNIVQKLTQGGHSFKTQRIAALVFVRLNASDAVPDH